MPWDPRGNIVLYRGVGAGRILAAAGIQVRVMGGNGVKLHVIGHQIELIHQLAHGNAIDFTCQRLASAHGNA